MNARKIVKLGIYLVFTVIISIILLAAAVYFFKDSIIERFSEQLKKNSSTYQISYNNIRLSVFEQFPNTSIVLGDFSMATASESVTKTIIRAEKISLNINLISLLNRQIVVNNLTLSNGTINLDKSTIDSLWTGQDETSLKTGFVTEKASVKLVDCSVSMPHYSVTAENLTIKYQKRVDTKLRIKGLLRYSSRSRGGAIRELPLDIDIHSTILPDSVLIHRSGIKHNGIKSFFGGYYSLKNHRGVVRFYTKSFSLEQLVKFTPLVPDNLKQLKGRLSLTGRIAYTEKSGIGNIKLNYRFSDLLLMAENRKITCSNLRGISNIDLIGRNSSSIVQYKKLNINRIEFNGKAKLKGYTSLVFYTLGNSKITNHTAINSAMALSALNGRYKAVGTIDRQHRIHIYRLYGKAQLALVAGKKYSRFDRIKGSLKITDNKLNFTLSGQFDSTDLQLNGKLSNLLEIANTKTPAHPQISITGKYLDLDYILGSIAGSDTLSKTSGKNSTIRTSLRYNIDRLTYLKYTYRKVKGRMEIYENECIKAEFRGTGFYGSVRGQIGYCGEKEKLALAFEKLNVSDLLKHFNNFGQSIIGHENVSGTISGRLSCELSNNSYGIDWDRSKLTGRFTLRNGTLTGMDKLTKISPWLNPKRLKQIYFNTITNTIIIKKGCVYIPSMDILTNAFGLNISGKHTLDNRYEYRINLNLSDLMAKKFLSTDIKTISKSSKGFINLKLKLWGIGDKYEVSLEKKRKQTEKKKVKDNLKQIKAAVKSDLKQLFSGKSDSNRVKTDTTGYFQIEWDEYDTTKLP